MFSNKIHNAYTKFHKYKGFLLINSFHKNTTWWISSILSLNKIKILL